MFKGLLEALGREEHKRLLELQQEFIDLLPMSTDVDIHGNKLVVSEHGEELFYAVHNIREPRLNYASSGGLELLFKVKAVESTFEEYYHESVPMRVFCEVLYQYGIVANFMKKHPKFQGFTTSFCRTTIDAQIFSGNLRVQIMDVSRPGEPPQNRITQLVKFEEHGVERSIPYTDLKKVLEVVDDLMNGKFPSQRHT